MLIDEFTDYLTNVRRYRTNTIKVRRFYLEKWRHRHPALLTATLTDMEAWIDGSEWKEETVNVVTSTLRGFYRWLHSTGRIDRNPAADLTPVKVHSRAAAIATDQAIISALTRATTVEAAIIMLAAECGLRVHEIAKLATTDREGPWLTIDGKGGQIRVVHASPELCYLLDGLEARQGVGYYFRGRNGHVSHSYIYKHIQQRVRINPHALRHRAGTAAYRGTGNDIRVAQEFLGHSQPATTAKYVHVERVDLERASAATRLLAA